MWLRMQLNLSACRILVSVLWIRGSSSLSFSIAVVAVDRTASMIKQSVWFLTLSRYFWFICTVVDHAMEPYSRWGLTVSW